MARLKDLAVSRGGDTFLFDPETIKVDHTYNSRNMSSPETLEHIEKMTLSILERGTSHFPPVSVYQKEGEVYLITGHCRREAFIEARKRGAPVKGILAVANTQSEEERTLDLLDSNDGLPLTMMEKAAVVKRLTLFGWTPSEIAKKRGASVKSITDLLALLEAPAEIKEMVASNQISATLAVEVGKESPGKAVEILKDAVETAKEQGKTKATRQHIKTNIKEVEVKLKACPFCSCFLVLEEADRHRHPGDTCYLAGATVDDVEIELWNKRG